MKLGIMQPYAFPYLGYFQLINAVDLFVLYDDVAFEKQGWINRNALGARQGRQNFTLPVHKPRLGQPISEMRLSEPKINQRKLLRTIDVLYRRAPHYEQVMPVLKSAIVHDDENLARYLRHSLDVVTAYLGISTPLVRSSERHRQIALKGQERVIESAVPKAHRSTSTPKAEGSSMTTLNFVATASTCAFSCMSHALTARIARSFVPRLSIIDVMMFNNRQEIARLLTDYRLVSGTDGS